jgi:8-oxo-dGTP pyrophosphatase MutT (NUDIX family)
MNHPQKDGSEETVFRGKIFEVIHQPMKIGDKRTVFEIARRAPGVRLIIVRDKKILISREYRSELNGFDYRLPGGKVFDTLDEFEQARGRDILPSAKEAAIRECREEAGLVAETVSHFVTSKVGATVEWDLVYFIIDQFSESELGQELEAGEVIDVQWMDFEEAKELCRVGKISEDRTVGVLFRFFLNQSQS